MAAFSNSVDFLKLLDCTLGGRCQRSLVYHERRRVCSGAASIQIEQSIHGDTGTRKVASEGFNVNRQGHVEPTS